MCASKQKTTIVPSVKRILFRRSGVRIESTSAVNMPIDLRPDDHDGAARRLDLLPRRSRHRVRVDLELSRDRAVAQHLDPGVLADESLRGERLGRDLAVGGVLLEPPDVHGDERPSKAVLEAAELRDPHMERGLATFEPARQARPGARQLALCTPAGGLSLTLGSPAADPAAQLARAARAGNLVLADHRDELPSPVLATSTVTRWATWRSIPRRTGVSSCPTTWPVRRRPSAESVRRARSFSPLALLCWRISTRVTAPYQRAGARRCPASA